jgi:hypothetical protein
MLKELPSVESFPGAACLARASAASNFEANRREIRLARYKAACQT